MSKETLEFHYGKHHKTYVDNLNKFVEGDAKLQGKSLEEIIKSAGPGKPFNNAAQVWNHTFFWNGLRPGGGGAPTGKIGAAIDKQFGSFEAFKTKFNETSINHFASGWGWLVKKADGSLECISTANAGTPMTDGHTALLTCDVWEHAYYIDYRNARAKFLDAFWNLVNWDFVEKNLG
jgi:Fe-Mn family superoxide dismutase